MVGGFTRFGRPFFRLRGCARGRCLIGVNADRGNVGPLYLLAKFQRQANRSLGVHL